MLEQNVNNHEDDFVSVLMTGDLVLDLPDAGHWLSGIAPRLGAADLCIGHLEVPHTDNVHSEAFDIPAPGAPLENLSKIAEAGFTCVSLAGNHIYDCGAKGIKDTTSELSRTNISFTGAGKDLDAARKPAILTAKGRKIALLSYNCVGPQEAWAGKDKAGCHYLPVVTETGEGVRPVSKILSADKKTLNQLKIDVTAARKSGAEFIIAALHKGRVHTPYVIEPYERELAKLAIDAGCDVVVSHHAHIIRGIECYKGKPIFHGLGNGCVVTSALSPGQDDPDREAWVQKRQALFGFTPDPAYTYAPFHPEAVNGMIAMLKIASDGQIKAGFIPLYVEAPGRPVIATGAVRDSVISYVQDITRKAGLTPLKINDLGEFVEVLS